MFSEILFLAVTTPLYALLIIGEIIASHLHHKGFYTVKDTLSNLYLTSLNMGLDILMRGVVLAILLYFNGFNLLGNYQIPPIIYWVGLFIAEDFVFYWLHRIDHSMRLFWAVHVTHHSSEHFNLTTGFRSSVFQPLYRVIYFIPLALIFNPLDILLMYSVTQVYGILVHTQSVDKMGILEYILITPSHHRVHHASNVLYLDKNLGMCLLIWDKLFGTFQPELASEPVRYGLHKNVSDKGAANIVFHEWKAIYKDSQKATKWSDKLKYLLAPPGWSHDGSSQTAAQIRAAQTQEKATERNEKATEHNEKATEHNEIAG
jgi:sterol desaturase/sphingolipid hydroxylase (fatty acid hydroxylase superfamily)